MARNAGAATAMAVEGRRFRQVSRRPLIEMESHLLVRVAHEPFAGLWKAKEAPDPVGQ
jgi:hypothetical protein